MVQTILEVLTFLLLPMGATPFTDVPTDRPFARAVATASAYGIVSGGTARDGTPLGTFCPR